MNAPAASVTGLWPPELHLSFWEQIAPQQCEIHQYHARPSLLAAPCEVNLFPHPHAKAGNTLVKWG